MTTEELHKAVESALNAGPRLVERWSCSNPPTDVEGSPAVYEIPVLDKVCVVDKWLVDLCLAHKGREYAIRFLASEAAAFGYRGELDT